MRIMVRIGKIYCNDNVESLDPTNDPEVALTEQYIQRSYDGKMGHLTMSCKLCDKI